MNQEMTLRLTLETGWTHGIGGRLESQRLYLNTTIPRAWMPSRHRKRGTSFLLTCEFPTNPRRWWGIVRYVLANDREPHGDLVGPWEGEPHVLRHAANTYTRTWATGEDIHMSTTINRRTVSQVAEACPGLDPLWIGSRFVDRAIQGAVRWHHAHGVVELWWPLSASEGCSTRTSRPAQAEPANPALPAERFPA